MFDIGGTELMVVAIVAILFVGPRELPGMLRTFGQMVRRVRGLAGDFQRQFDDALKDAELDGVKKSLQDVRNLDPTKALKDRLNPLKADLSKTAEDIDAGLAQPARKVEMDEKGMPIFDDADAPTAPEPVKVDVEAALARQRELDTAASTAGTPEEPAPGPKSKSKPATDRKPKAKKKPAGKASA